MSSAPNPKVTDPATVELVAGISRAGLLPAEQLLQLLGDTRERITVTTCCDAEHPLGDGNDSPPQS